MANAIEFLREYLQPKLESIDGAIQLYNTRVTSYAENRNRIGEESKLKIVDKINTEFDALFQALHNKQQQILEDLNDSFRSVLDEELKIPNRDKCEMAVSNLTTCKEKGQLLLNETNAAIFLEESSKISQEIDKNLYVLMVFQIDNLNDPTTSIQFPDFNLDLDELIATVNAITLQCVQEVTPEVQSMQVSTPDVQPVQVSTPEIHSTQVVTPAEQSTQVSTPATFDSILEPEINQITDDTCESGDQIEAKDEVTFEDTTRAVVPYNILSLHRKYKFVVLFFASPSELYLQLLTKEFNQMIPKITQYHADIDANPGLSQVVTFANVEQGEYYFAKYPMDNFWYRALICSKQSDSVEVYFVDYGNTDKVPFENLRFLPENFASFPKQAFKCSLNTIKPNNGDHTTEKYQWDETVTKWVDIVLDAHRSVYGYVYESGGENELELDIFLSTETIREIEQEHLISITPAQLTLLDKEHISLCELLISGSMALEKDEGIQRCFFDDLSFSNSTSSRQSAQVFERCEKREYSDLFGTLLDDNVTEYYFPYIYQEDGAFTCMLSHVESPTLFYTHVVHTRNAIIDDIAREIANFVAETPATDEHEIELLQPCIAINTTDELWYRCLVLEIDKEKSSFFVFFVDFGNTASVLAKEILPINGRLIRYPVQALPCRLCGIKPPKNKMLWPSEPIETFKNISFNTILTAYMTSSAIRERIHNNVTIMKECLMKVRLVDYDQIPECLNDRLVELGYADVIGSPQDTDLSISPISFSNSPDEIGDWDPRQSDFHSSTNTYNYDDESVQVALQQHSRQSSISLICRFFNTNKGCTEGASCRYAHTNYSDTYPNKFEIPGKNDVMQLPPESSFIFCTVTAIHSPEMFYISCPKGALDLSLIIKTGEKGLLRELEEKYPMEDTEYYQLFNEMQAFYSKKVSPTIPEDWRRGQTAVALSSAQKWYRCRIVDPDGVKVFYLDYGYPEVVAIQNMRKIESKFIKLPFQAILCTLSEVKVNPDKIETAKDRFEELVKQQFFLGRIQSMKNRPAISLYFLSEFSEGKDPSKCLNDILCKEGYFRYCDTTDVIEKKVKFHPD